MLVVSLVVYYNYGAGEEKVYTRRLQSSITSPGITDPVYHRDKLTEAQFMTHHLYIKRETDTCSSIIFISLQSINFVSDISITDNV
jgi:hypothetical protein